jgi:hypothetical protein
MMRVNKDPALAQALQSKANQVQKLALRTRHSANLKACSAFDAVMGHEKDRCRRDQGGG